MTCQQKLLQTWLMLVFLRSVFSMQSECEGNSYPSSCATVRQQSLLQVKATTDVNSSKPKDKDSKKVKKAVTDMLIEDAGSEETKVEATIANDDAENEEDEEKEKKTGKDAESDAEDEAKSGKTKKKGQDQKGSKSDKPNKKWGKKDADNADNADNVDNADNADNVDNADNGNNADNADNAEDSVGKAGNKTLDPLSKQSTKKDDASCKPECRWSCVSKLCEETCTPDCKPPKCETRCAAIDLAGCDMECGKPDCATICPSVNCTKGGCPACHTKCTEPQCKLKCPQSQSKCESICATPECDWTCTKPEICPAPVCSLQCDEVAKECDNGIHKSVPPLKDDEIKVESFTPPKNDLKLTDFEEKTKKKSKKDSKKKDTSLLGMQSVHRVPVPVHYKVAGNSQHSQKLVDFHLKF